MAQSLRQQVRKRAGNCCEYCRLPQRCTVLPHELDHIRAKKHHGLSALENLCWACAYCNGHKGSNAAGYDPETGRLVPLFNPRRQKWANHFAWRGPVLVGNTAVARATIDVLAINTPERLQHRRMLMMTGEFLP